LSVELSSAERIAEQPAPAGLHQISSEKEH
jgi:hypothetical protein